MSHTRFLTSLIFSLSGGLLLAQGPGPAVARPAQPAQPAKPVDMDAVSYIIGANLGQQLKTNQVEANLDQVINGVKEGFAGGEPKYSKEEQQEIMTAFQTELRGKAEKRQKQLGEKNIKIGADFLAENAKKEGIVTTESGLQYQILTEGTGPKPAVTDSVMVNYKGSVIDGTVFDESRDAPTKLAINRTVKGWQEALPMMPAGSKWKLFIPADLAYGPTQRGPVIEPNSVLIFDIELVEIAKKAVATTPPVAIPARPSAKPTAQPKPAKQDKP